MQHATEPHTRACSHAHSTLCCCSPPCRLLPPAACCYCLLPAAACHTGTIPEVWGNLPYLEAVDISNTRMSCCASQAEADARAARGVNSLVPPFLEFGGLLRQFDITSNQEEQEGSPTDAGDVL